MEKIFALHGRLSGSARVLSEKGSTVLRLSSDQSLPAACTAYLLCGGKLRALPVNGAAGSVQEELSPEALLVAAGEDILFAGGFAGKKALFEKCKTELRLYLLSEAQHSKAAQPQQEEPPKSPDSREEAPTAQPKQTEAPHNTMPPTEEPSPAQNAYEPSERHTPGEGTRPSSAAPTFAPVLAEILERARALFAPLSEACSQTASAEKAPPEAAPKAPEPRFCPFPNFYPEARWRRVPYPGTQRCYLEGIVQTESGRLLLHGIPGEYSPVPPVPNFKRFLRDRDGCGYWIRIRRF